MEKTEFIERLKQAHLWMLLPLDALHVELEKCLKPDTQLKVPIGLAVSHPGFLHQTLVLLCGATHPALQNPFFGFQIRFVRFQFVRAVRAVPVFSVPTVPACLERFFLFRYNFNRKDGSGSVPENGSDGSSSSCGFWKNISNGSGFWSRATRKTKALAEKLKNAVQLQSQKST